MTKEKRDLKREKKLRRENEFKDNVFAKRHE